ncbi:PIN domain-containing protein [Aliarcobacter butzleri]|uniref:PIN domain-containing protein n=1 Tax=Aliarcobacter butzleri TaxID=28197 RepID=A0AAW6VPD7_9BACT|nr:PIN domain-containing protein [Aliarcobacter butzleri]MDK2062395.1 PIN domain-containing protein [Aliarcobacter butzleri]
MFDKYYVLDTNILLEDATNIYKLSQDGKNLIILAETVLDEIDTKKSGFDEINFQAREFVLGRKEFSHRVHSHLAS